MEIFVLSGVHMFERSEFGPQNKKLQISCHEFIKQLKSMAMIYIQPATVKTLEMPVHPSGEF